MTGAVWTRLSAAGWESEAGVSVNLLVLFSLRRKEHHSPFWKRQKVFVLFLCGKKKNKKEAAGHSENRKQIYIHLYFCIRFFCSTLFSKSGAIPLDRQCKKELQRGQRPLQSRKKLLSAKRRENGHVQLFFLSQEQVDAVEFL